MKKILLLLAIVILNNNAFALDGCFISINNPYWCYFGDIPCYDNNTDNIEHYGYSVAKLCENLNTHESELNSVNTSLSSLTNDYNSLSSKYSNMNSSYASLKDYNLQLEVLVYLQAKQIKRLRNKIKTLQRG